MKVQKSKLSHQLGRSASVLGVRWFGMGPVRTVYISTGGVRAGIDILWGEKNIRKVRSGQVPEYHGKLVVQFWH